MYKFVVYNHQKHVKCVVSNDNLAARRLLSRMMLLEQRRVMKHQDRVVSKHFAHFSRRRLAQHTKYIRLHVEGP